MGYILVEVTLPPSIVATITSIPISRQANEDLIMWHGMPLQDISIFIIYKHMC